MQQRTFLQIVDVVVPQVVKDSLVSSDAGGSAGMRVGEEDFKESVLDAQEHEESSE